MPSDVKIDLRVAELLASRLCHDLVGPIGAVNNGMELIEDEEPGMIEEALKLTAGSARQAANVLQFFRLAYGMAGGRLGGDLIELRDLVTGYLGGGKVTLDWSVQSGAGGAPDGLGKLVLNLVALAVEALPKGGKLSVGVQPGSGGLEASVTAEGPGAKLREESVPALNPDVNVTDLTPRSVQGYFTRLLARRAGGDLAVDTSHPGRLVFTVKLPA
ncbi:MAG TPA: histidine phosphotransferase family protein [Kiloniellales bacterium]|jgi:histidine phosphotransferase ChpT